MPAITYDQFDVGLDRRKGPSVSDANRLRELKNAYVTTGKTIRVRPALTKVTTLEAGTKGLVAGLGKLNTFYESGSISHAHSLFEAHKVAHPSTSQNVKSVPAGDVFDGYLYVAVEYTDDSVWHHYLDGGSPTHITDSNCPHSASFTKIASKIWSPDGDVVRFSATGLPRNWTLSADAGFLPAGLQQRGSRDVTAVGQRERDLVAYFRDSSQVWSVDPDPELHVFKSPVIVGTRFPRSIGQVSNDSYFLSDMGYRSISVQGISDNLTDADVGSPIDRIVEPLVNDSITPIAGYYAGGGQYWCCIGNVAHIYTFSSSAKISAWSEYEFSVTPDDLAELNGDLYLRSGDDVYRVDKDGTDDDGADFDITIELPFLDFKKPGVEKVIHGVDAVVQGEAEIAFRWDPRDTSLITDPIPLTGDTRTGDLTPVEMTAAAIAPVITGKSSTFEQLDALTFYFEHLRVM